MIIEKKEDLQFDTEQDLSFQNNEENGYGLYLDFIRYVGAQLIVCFRPTYHSTFCHR